MQSSNILGDLFPSLVQLNGYHAPASQVYSLLKQVARKEIESLFSQESPVSVDFGPFGRLLFPYHSMGAVDSLNLFDLDELIIFSFYWNNRNVYRKVADMGANLGLHSILLAKCGFEVCCYEPDPFHFKILRENLSLNDISDVESFNMAVSTQEGETEFVRVLGNTTGSHLAGAKLNPYGELERFPVKIESFRKIMKERDLLKIDIEGHEREVLLGTTASDWELTDALVEIENVDNASAIYEHFRGSGVRLFSQKCNWEEVHNPHDMPTSYRDGTLFITTKDRMPW